MADGSNITPFPGVPLLRVVEQSSAGRYEFNDEPRDRVEITAGLTKIYAVRVDGAIWPGAEFDTTTNALRVASLLNDLDRLGALPSPDHPQARAMFAASVANIQNPPDVA